MVRGSLSWSETPYFHIFIFTNGAKIASERRNFFLFRTAISWESFPPGVQEKRKKVGADLPPRVLKSPKYDRFNRVNEHLYPHFRSILVHPIRKEKELSEDRKESPPECQLDRGSKVQNVSLVFSDARHLTLGTESGNITSGVKEEVDHVEEQDCASRHPSH